MAGSIPSSCSEPQPLARNVFISMDLELAHFKSAAKSPSPQRRRGYTFPFFKRFRTFRTFNQLDYRIMQFAVFRNLFRGMFFFFKSLSRVWFYRFDTHQTAAPSRNNPEISASKMLVGPADPPGSQRQRWWCKHLGVVGIAIALFRGRCLLFNQLGILRKRCACFLQLGIFVCFNKKHASTQTLQQTWLISSLLQVTCRSSVGCWRWSIAFSDHQL